jgi:hypothetical protein
MKSMTHLTLPDQHHVQSFAQQATGWFRLFDNFTPSAKAQPQPMTLNTRLEIIGALHRMIDFRDYIHPFLKDDDRITAFEDAVAEAVYVAIVGQPVHDV